jgi:hypothetical protein
VQVDISVSGVVAGAPIMACTCPHACCVCDRTPSACDVLLCTGSFNSNRVRYDLHFECIDLHKKCAIFVVSEAEAVQLVARSGASRNDTAARVQARDGMSVLCDHVERA